jgi:hypothetical protein
MTKTAELTKPAAAKGKKTVLVVDDEKDIVEMIGSTSPATATRC